jgi:predicted AAA+ superfamily ATPase
VSFTEDRGRLLENMVFMHLRRQTRELYYFSETRECDFVVFKNGKLLDLIQVCIQLDHDNLDRELAGLTEAMDFFNKKEGVIITGNQSDSFNKNGKTITAIPFYKWAVNPAEAKPAGDKD